MADRRRLSRKSRSLLYWISEGKSYDQIVREEDVSYSEIFMAAEEALALDSQLSGSDSRSNEEESNAIDRAKAKHPRAYERWSTEDDTKLIEMARSGKTAKELSRSFGRQPSAIRARLRKLGEG